MARKYQHTQMLLGQIQEMLARGMTQALYSQFHPGRRKFRFLRLGLLYPFWLLQILREFFILGLDFYLQDSVS
jgi:hypothetical protein